MQNAWIRINKAMKNIQKVILTEEGSVFMSEKDESLNDDFNREEINKKESDRSYDDMKKLFQKNCDSKSTLYYDENTNKEKIYTRNILYHEIINSINLFTSFIKNEKAKLFMDEYNIKYYNSEGKEFFLLNFICICKYLLYILTKILNINIMDKFECINMKKEEYDYNITHLFFNILKVDKLFEISNDLELNKENNKDNKTHMKNYIDHNKEKKEYLNYNYFKEEKYSINEEKNYNNLEGKKENPCMNLMDQVNNSGQFENVVVTEVLKNENLNNVHHKINIENNEKKNNQINNIIKKEVNIINESNQMHSIYHNNTYKQKSEVKKENEEKSIKDRKRENYNNIKTNNKNDRKIDGDVSTNNNNNNILYNEVSAFIENVDLNGKLLKKREDTRLKLNKSNEIFPNKESLMECEEEDFYINNKNEIDLKNIIKSINEENNVKINLLNDKIKYLKSEIIKNKKDLLNFEKLKSDLENYKNELNNKNKIIEDLNREKSILQENINIIQSKLDDKNKINEDNERLTKYCQENHVDKQIIIEIIKNSQDTLKTKNIRNQIFLILCDILGIKNMIEGLQEKTISDQFLEFLDEETKEF